MSTELARKLRRSPGEPERAMWRILSHFRRQGIHFGRQVEIGEPMVSSNDASRDNYLSGRGYRVLRFWNNEVIRILEGVYDAVARALAEHVADAATPTPDPSPQGGGRHNLLHARPATPR
ncbi:MAG: endonuclease domain-containing protein [Devosia sp.]